MKEQVLLEAVLTISRLCEDDNTFHDYQWKVVEQKDLEKTKKEITDSKPKNSTVSFKVYDLSRTQALIFATEKAMVLRQIA